MCSLYTVEVPNEECNEGEEETNTVAYCPKTFVDMSYPGTKQFERTEKALFVILTTDDGSDMLRSIYQIISTHNVSIYRCTVCMRVV